FGQYQDVEPPQAVPVPRLNTTIDVTVRSSRQGLITIVNRGPKGRPFRICTACGYAEVVPMKRNRTERSHRDPRRGGRDCRGVLVTRQLGHEYLTDVVEIRLNAP